MLDYRLLPDLRRDGIKAALYSALAWRDSLASQSVLVRHSVSKAAVQVAAFGTEADDRLRSMPTAGLVQGRVAGLDATTWR